MNIRTPAVAVLLAVTAVLGVSACAPTATRQSSGEYVDDAAITARVKGALLNEPNVKATAINVETYRGVVSLSGFVDSQDMASKALSKAKGVSGVREVKNDMRVKPAS
jgi:osmotically-inducible protein OsmY